MDQDKFLQLQMQMRHNNEDYKHFLDDMDSWSAQMRDKEQINPSKATDERRELPQIRNAAKTNKAKPKPAKIKAYDYRSWDKFDVNKALEECDNAEGEAAESDALALSDEHKERGNAHFKDGNYAAAIEEYGTAIQYNPRNDVLFTNRAMAFIKLADYVAAEVDCCEALKINDKCVKAFYRRSKCRLSLNKSDLALEDLRAVVSIDPSNKAAMREMRQLEAELNTRGVVEPLFRPPEDRQSLIPLRRIAIVDVDPNKCFDSAAAETERMRETAPIETERMRETAPIDTAPMAATAPNETERMAATDSKSSTDIAEYRPPRSSMQLSKDLSRLRSDRHRLGAYVAALDFSSIRRLIGHALDSEMVLDIVNGLSAALQQRLLSPQQFVDSVNRLHAVARFASSWLMIDDDEKAPFREAVTTIGDVMMNKLLVSL